MSDPVTNVEIDDVLSSIRRLISENDRSPKPAETSAVRPDPAVSERKRAEAADESIAEAADEGEKPQDRLVLTPSLRVAESAHEPETHDTGGVGEALETAQDHVCEDAEAAPEAEPDGVADKVLAEIEEELAEAGYDPVDGVSLERAREIDSRIVHWDHMGDRAGASEPAYEPDEPGDSDYAGTDVEPLQWQDEPQEAATDEVEPQDEVEAEPVFVHAPMEGADEPAPETMSTYDDEMPAEEALAGLAGRIEAELRDAIPGQVEADLSAEADFDALAEDDAVVLDEAVLRDMVADIVRQELQGALGERITRNVRKLVRREIHRALAAHELD